jgi:hypothetical protein
MQLELNIDFSDGLQGVKLRHSVWSTSINQKARSLYSDWQFKTEKEWDDFKGSINSM